MIPNLGKLIKARRQYAYGEQADYFDDDHIVGWVRRGDIEHEHSGLAVVMSDGDAGTLTMDMGQRFAGEPFYDLTERCAAPVIIDENGLGAFPTEGRNVSVWARRPAFEDIIINE